MVLYVNEIIDGMPVERIIAKLSFNGAESLRDTLDYYVEDENQKFAQKYGYFDMMENEVL